MSFRRAVVAFTIVVLIEFGTAEDQTETGKNEVSKIITLLNSAGTLTPDPKALKREVTFENPRVMQPYHIIQASQQRPIIVPRPVTCTPPTRKGPNCIRAFLINQLRETNDNINRLLECLKKNDAQICSKGPIQLCNEQPPPQQRCEPEIKQLILPEYTTDRPYTDMDATTTLQDIRFCNEYIKEESEEVDTNRYSSAKRFPSTCSCEALETTPKPRRRCSKAPPAPMTTKRPCRTMASRKPATKKPCRKSSGECKCVFCVEDGTCAGDFD